MPRFYLFFSFFCLYVVGKLEGQQRSISTEKALAQLLRVHEASRIHLIDTAHILEVHYTNRGSENGAELFSTEADMYVRRSAYLDTSVACEVKWVGGYSSSSMHRRQFYKEQMKEAKEGMIETIEEETDSPLTSRQKDSIRNEPILLSYFDEILRPEMMIYNDIQNIEDILRMPKEDVKKWMSETKGVQLVKKGQINSEQNTLVIHAPDEVKHTLVLDKENRILRAEYHQVLEIPWYISLYAAVVERLGVDDPYFQYEIGYRYSEKLKKWHVDYIDYTIRATCIQRLWFEPNELYDFVLQARVDVKDVKVADWDGVDGRIINRDKPMMLQFSPMK